MCRSRCSRLESCFRLTCTLSLITHSTISGNCGVHSNFNSHDWCLLFCTWLLPRPCTWSIDRWTRVCTWVAQWISLCIFFAHYQQRQVRRWHHAGHDEVEDAFIVYVTEEPWSIGVIQYSPAPSCSVRDIVARPNGDGSSLVNRTLLSALVRDFSRAGWTWTIVVESLCWL